MIKKFWYNLITPTILILLGSICIYLQFNNENTKELKSLNNLIENGISIKGTLSNNYNERKVQISRVPVYFYDTKYTFKVNGKKYENKKTFKIEKPKSNQIEIVYHKENPNINEANPKESMVTLKEKQQDKTALYLGLFLIMIGGIFGFKRLK